MMGETMAQPRPGSSDEILNRPIHHRRQVRFIRVFDELLSTLMLTCVAEMLTFRT